jgi:hypothetical protein
MKNLVKKINNYIKQGSYNDAINIIKDFEDYKNYPFLNRYLRLCERKSNQELIRSNLDDLESFEKDCICLNTTINELAKIEKLFSVWLGFHEIRSFKKNNYFTNLVIAFDVHDEKIISALRKLIIKYKIDEIFKLIDIITIDIPTDFNFYKRVDDGLLDLKKYIYGYKSGPNYQFYALMKRLILEGYRNVFVCETDTFPLREDWANSLMKEAALRNDFWILGSPFLGKSKLDPSLALHINGSAIYGLQSEGFKDFLKQWEFILLSLIPEIPYIAYDWAMDYYFHDKITIKNWDNLSYADFHQQINFKKMCTYTDLIINLAGEPERNGVGNYSLSDVLRIYPKASIVHGHYFYDEIKFFLRR